MLSGRAPSQITLTALAVALLLAIFLFSYLPDLGHGFISDDHRWIRESQIVTAGDVARIFQSHVGFYRPVVALSFGLDSLAWGSNAVGYSSTNLIVLLADAVLVLLLARRLALPLEAAVWASAVWLFNFHAVNMALLWLSGRTALLTALFGLAATVTFLGRPEQRRSLTYLGTGVLTLMAMLCKEEAVTLPILFTAWGVIDHGTRDRRAPSVLDAASRAWPAWAALGIYAALRLQSGAFGPTSAPSYYQFTFAIGDVLRNVAEYLDRGATVAIAVSLLLWLATGRTLRFEPAEKRVLRLGCLWFAAWSALTVFLPVRSSLYALVPSIGAALCAAAIAAAARRHAAQRTARVAAVLLVATLVAVPIYRARNARWVATADLSTHVLATVKNAAEGRTSGRVLLIDDPTARVSLQSTFGGLFPDAVAMWIGPLWRGELVESEVQATDGTALVFRLQGDTLVSVPR